MYILVFPAASSPSIKSRISFDPKTLFIILEMDPPMLTMLHDSLVVALEKECGDGKIDWCSWGAKDAERTSCSGNRRGSGKQGRVPTFKNGKKVIDPTSLRRKSVARMAMSSIREKVVTWEKNPPLEQSFQ